MEWEAIKYSKVAETGYRLFLNVPKGSRMFPTECFRIFENVIEYSRLFQNILECSTMNKNLPDCTWVFLTLSNGSENVLQCYRIFQNVHKYRTTQIVIESRRRFENIL